MPGVRQRVMTPSSTAAYPFMTKRKGLYQPRLTTAAAVASWSPAQLTNPVSWYDASDTATITASSNAVSQWNDKIGTNHLTQGTGANQPTTGSTINGKNVVTFNGTSHWMQKLTTPALSQPGTIWAVFKLSSTAGSQIFVDGGNGNRWLLWNQGGQTTFQLYAGGFANTGVNTDTSIHSHVVVFNGASSSYDIDGTPHTPLNAGTGTNAGITLGASEPAGTANMAGAWCELAYTSSAASAPDVALWLTYVRAKWGTP